MEKRYLGDGVYAEIEHGMIKLTTEPGLDDVRDTIYLEPEVMNALLTFNIAFTKMRQGEQKRIDSATA